MPKTWSQGSGWGEGRWGLKCKLYTGSRGWLGTASGVRIQLLLIKTACSRACLDPALGNWRQELKANLGYTSVRPAWNTK